MDVSDCVSNATVISHFGEIEVWLLLPDHQLKIYSRHQDVKQTHGKAVYTLLALHTSDRRGPNYQFQGATPTPRHPNDTKQRAN